MRMGVHLYLFIGTPSKGPATRSSSIQFLIFILVLCLLPFGAVYLILLYYVSIAVPGDNFKTKSFIPYYV